jgi:hypothetical protein
MEYPPLLSAKHIAHICSCHITTAYKIMEQKHRPVWRNGKMVRLHRDVFLAQLAEESQQPA